MALQAKTMRWKRENFLQQVGEGKEDVVEEGSSKLEDIWTEEINDSEVEGEAMPLCLSTAQTRVCCSIAHPKCHINSQ